MAFRFPTICSRGRLVHVISDQRQRYMAMAQRTKLGSVIRAFIDERSAMYRLRPGGTRSCVASEDMSLMEVALRHSIPGIIAECNGSAACATCHVVIELTAAELDAPDDHENDMLDFTQTPREPGSRLSCQIRVDSRLDGAVVRIPAEA